MGILGLKDDRERILTALHDLRVAQIESLPPETLAQLAPERGTELQRKIGDETLRFRGLLSALPSLPAGTVRRFDTVDEILAAAAGVPIDAEVGSLKTEDDRLITEERSIDETLGVLDHLAFYPGRIEDLRAKSVLSFLGETEAETFGSFRRELAPTDDPTFLTGPGPDRSTRFLVVVRRTSADALAKAAQHNGVRLVPLPAVNGTVPDERTRLAARRAEVDPASASRSRNGSGPSPGTGTAPSPRSTRPSRSRTARSRRSRSSGPADSASRSRPGSRTGTSPGSSRSSRGSPAARRTSTRSPRRRSRRP